MISVVVPVLNAEPTLGFQLEALAAQTYAGAWEVIVADNGSTDRSMDVARSHEPRLPALTIVDASAQRSRGFARNTGAAAAAGDFLAFCDADDVATPRWLEALAAASVSFDLVGGPLEAQALNDPVTWPPRPAFPQDHPPVGLDFLPYSTTSNLGVRADVFRALGGFPTSELPLCECDFCWRAQLRSYRLGWAPDAVMLYRFRTTTLDLARQFALWGRSHAVLYRSFRSHGMPRSSVRNALHAWAWIALHAPDLMLSARGRRTWARVAGMRWGRLRGSVERSVLYL